MLHLDVMDGHFVPNLTIGPSIVKAIRKITKATLDVHLMITDPDRYAPVFIEAGADCVSVHQETCRHLDGTLRMIQSEGARAGVVINPATPVSALENVLDSVDQILIMSVNPGFGGQGFIAQSLVKLRETRALVGARPIDIEVDGGVEPANAAEIVRAGANVLVAGNSIFQGNDPATYGPRIAALRKAAQTLQV